MFGCADLVREKLQQTQTMMTKFNSIQESHNVLKIEVEKIADKLNRINDKADGKCERDDIIELKEKLNQLSQRVDNVDSFLQSVVTLDILKQELDVISKCIEEFMMSGTPRGGVPVDVSGFEKRLAELENKLSTMPQINATDGLFRVPVKSVKK